MWGVGFKAEGFLFRVWGVGVGCGVQVSVVDDDEGDHDERDGHGEPAAVCRRLGV